MIGSRSYQALHLAPSRISLHQQVRSNYHGSARPAMCLLNSPPQSVESSSSTTATSQPSSSPSPLMLPWQPLRLSWSSLRLLSSSTNSFTSQKEPLGLLECSDERTQEIAERDFLVIQDFITEEEEEALLKEVERFLKKVRYEYDHWDNAIHGFREKEKSRWSEVNSPIIQRIRDRAFPAGSSQLSLVHVLDLAQNGYIKPHVDSVKFCGSTIAGLSLISPAVMRLVHTEQNNQWVNALLKPRSLYIMRDSMRYDYTHEVLKDEEAVFRGNPVTRDRRISVMCRAEVS